MIAPEALATLPNAEAAIGRVLIDAGLRAYSSIPAKSPVYPLAVVQRLGGVGSWPPASPDRARIQVDTWGDEQTKKNDVLDYARLAWRAAHLAEGQTVEIGNGEAVFLAAVNDEMMVQWLRDPRTARPRYIFTLSIACRAVDMAS